MHLKLIIFDLDGTLVDTALDITEALNHAIKPLGLKPLSIEETAALIGEGTSRLIEKALSPLGRKADDHAREAALKRFLGYYSENLAVHSRAYPNVKDTLRRLDSFDKAVLSNKKEALSRRLLEELGLAKHFSLIAGSDTTPSRKPSPEPVCYVLEKRGARPEEALLVGDSPYDIQAAKAAGVSAVAVTYGYRDRSLLEKADHTVEDFREIIQVLLELKAISEKRREPRYIVSPMCRKYITVRIKTAEEAYTPAVMLDLSRHGMMFGGPVRLEPGSSVECEVSIPKSFGPSVLIKGTVRHCELYAGEYLAGVEIREVSNEVWFRVFGKIIDFISARPEIY